MSIDTVPVYQCVAVCCSVLQCVAVCCDVLQCVAVCCSVLQCDAVCCSDIPKRSSNAMARIDCIRRLGGLAPLT